MPTDQLIQITMPTPFAVGPVNAYVLKGETITLIDCGPKTPAAKDILFTALKDLGLKPSDINQLVCTHYHPDHIGLAEEFQSYGAQVLTSAVSVPYVTGNETFNQEKILFYQELYKQSGVPDEDTEKELKQFLAYRRLCPPFTPDIIVSEGDELDGHNGWKFLFTPGHSPDHLSLYQPESQTFLSGDVLLPHISSNAIIEPPLTRNELRPKTLLDYRTTLKGLLHLPISQVYPGHGNVFTGSKQLIEKRLADQEHRAGGIERLLKEEGSLSLYEMAIRLFPHSYKKDLALVLSEVLGHLDLLAEEERVHSIVKNERMYFTVKENA